MPGIHTPFTNVGMLHTRFGFHIEDNDLNSINYNHKGKPKLWYAVPGKYGEKLEKLSAEWATSIGLNCNLYLRHKAIMVPPSVLKRNEIPFARVSYFHGF